jgi:prepilin-type N-terminal cleavage/methylation domain-containing protein
VRRIARGFTLLEMMVALAVVGATAAITVEVGRGVGSEQKQADAAARDLDAASKALALAAEDVRAGRYWTLDWTLAKGVLRRGEEVVARGVREWTVRPDGLLTRLSITLAPRNADSGATGAVTAGRVVRTRAKETP